MAQFTDFSSKSNINCNNNYGLLVIPTLCKDDEINLDLVFRNIYAQSLATYNRHTCLMNVPKASIHLRKNALLSRLPIYCLTRFAAVSGRHSFHIHCIQCRVRSQLVSPVGMEGEYRLKKRNKKIDRAVVASRNQAD